MPNVPIYHAHLKDFHAQLTHILQGECDFSAAGVALYTADASNYRQIPLGVVYPQTVDDLVNTVTLCKTFSLPVLLRVAAPLKMVKVLMRLWWWTAPAI